ncbi:MAG: hypothetical protein ACI9BD_000604, partial [Candidatus Marinamargulisbacteria bacterium]
MNKKGRFSLIVHTNSPGELMTWVEPFIKNFRSVNPNSKIDIMLLPCQYASGEEAKLAKLIPGIRSVYAPKETIKLLFSLPWFKKFKQTAILNLGGDPFYSQMFGIKYRCPVYAYTEHKRSPGLFFRHVFYKHKDGDIMSARIANAHLDRQEILQKFQLPDKPYCLFFSSSRIAHFKSLVPFYSDVVKKIRETNPDFTPILSVSRTIPSSELDKMKETTDLSAFHIVRASSLELLSISKLLVTIPGSNTAEAMYLHTPMIVLIPLNRPDLIQFDGLL